jgi:raffinose/stachyose/melibiose transport system permease protein
MVPPTLLGGRNRKLLGRVLLFVLLGAAALLWLVPFAVILLTSVRVQGELISEGIFSLPRKVELANFEKAWRLGQFATYFRNSAIVVIVKVPLGLLVSSLAAYPLAKMTFRLNKPIFKFFLLGLAVPVHVTLLPLVVMLKRLGLVNTLVALIPPYVVFGLPFQVFVLRGFFRTIPSEIMEAARIDGASELMIFLRIMIPLALPALATLFVIDALATWNELPIALVLINKDEWRPVATGLLRFQGQFSSAYTQLMAGVLITVAPVLVLYAVFQRYLVAGLTAGALKE